MTRLARLLREFDIDVQALNARERETSDLLTTTSSERTATMLLAMNLHGYYTALETLLERVARLLDDEVPSGPNWHMDLIEQMQTDVAALRPAVVPPEVALELHELRRFRHFFRNAYVLEFDSTRVRDHAKRLLRIHGPIASSLVQFRKHIAQLIESLSTSKP